MNTYMYAQTDTHTENIMPLAAHRMGSRGTTSTTANIPEELELCITN